MSNFRSFANRQPQIDDHAWVDNTALIIGDVHIGPHSSVWPYTVVRGDVEKIRIGVGSNIQDGCVLHVSHESRFAPGGQSLTIGDYVTVGHQATLHGCQIGSHCLIGIGARILDGAVLESRVMLGAGSLVTPGKVLEGGYLWVGAPVKKVRSLTEKELEYLTYAAEHYVRMAAQHREENQQRR